MIYEQLTITGDVEIVDSSSGQVVARRVTLTCERPCQLCGEQFMEGEEIEVTFPAYMDLEGIPRSGRSGPWEPGGLTSRWIHYHASEIIESSRRRILFTIE